MGILTTMPSAPSALRPYPLHWGSLGGLLRADARGCLLWSAGALIEHDWSAPAAPWSRPMVCRAAACAGDLIAVASPDGLRLVRGQGGAASGPLPCGAAGLLAVGGDRVAFVDPDGNVEVRSVGGSSALLRWPASKPVTALALSPDGALLVCACGREGQGFLAFLPLDGGPERSVSPLPVVRTLAFSPDGARLVGIAGRGIRVWDREARPAGELDQQPGEGAALAVAHDRVAVGYRGGPIALWRLPGHRGSGSYLGAVEGHHGTVRGLAFVAGGAGLASLAEDQSVALWEPPARSARHLSSPGLPPVEALALDPTARRLLVGHSSGRLSLLDPRSGRVERSMGLHPGGAFGVGWSPDASLLLSGGADALVRLWGARRGDLRAEGHAPGPVQAVAFAPDGRSVLAAGDGGLSRWPLPLAALVPGLGALSSKRRPPALLPLGALGPCHTLLWTPGLLAVGGADGRVHLGDGQGPPERAVQAQRGHIWALALAQAEPLLASGGDDGAVALIDPRFVERLVSLQTGPARVWSLAFAADGQRLAVGSGDGFLRLIDVLSGRIDEAHLGHGAEITSLIYLPGGGWISGARDGSLVRWARAPSSMAP